MHELVPKTRVQGTVPAQGEDLYSTAVDPAIVRRRVRHGFPKVESLSYNVDRQNVIVGYS